MSKWSRQPQTRFSVGPLPRSREPSAVSRAHTMAWQRVASLSEIAVDAVLGVDVDGSPVALYRMANEVFATAGICTHAMALLSDGFVEDGKIECPLHQGQFEIRSAKAQCAPATEDLRTYSVKLRRDEIMSDVEHQAE